MMGELPPEQNALFYDFCLEQHIPNNHLIHTIDLFLTSPKFESISLFITATQEPEGTYMDVPLNASQV